MSRAVRAPASELVGLESGEVAEAERARLQGLASALGRPIRVLAPAGAGRGVFWLAQQPWVAGVDAADGRPWALHVLALRLEAADRLGPEAVSFLAGAGAFGAGPAGWRTAWEALRPQLRADARLWWDGRPAQLAWGLDRLVGGLWAPEAGPRAEVVLWSEPFEQVAACAPQSWDVALGMPIGRRPLALAPRVVEAR